MKEIKNKIEHNEAILKEIRNRIMKEIWSIIPTSLAINSNHACYKYIATYIQYYAM